MQWLSSELAAIAADLNDEPDVEHTVHDVLKHAEVLTGGQGAGIMFTHGDDIREIAGSTPEAEKADVLQLECGEGPSVAAVSRGVTMVVDDVSTDSRWPQWAAPVAGMGVRSAISVPLQTGGSVLGALSLYSSEAAGFNPDSAQAAELYGRHACIAIRSAERRSGLRQAIDGRHVIGQAQGILMERHGVDADQAFTMLRRSALDQRITIDERAHHLVHDEATPRRN